MVKVAPRRRPRRRPLAWSRLGWLITTEAAFQVYFSGDGALHPDTLARLAYTCGYPTLAELRKAARRVLEHQEVIV